MLSARSVMRAGAAESGVVGELPANARIETVADQIERSDGVFNLRDANGVTVGHIGRREVIDVLVGRRGGA